VLSSGFSFIIFPLIPLNKKRPQMEINPNAAFLSRLLIEV